MILAFKRDDEASVLFEQGWKEVERCVFVVNDNQGKWFAWSA